MSEHKVRVGTAVLHRWWNDLAGQRPLPTRGGGPHLHSLDCWCRPEVAAIVCRRNAEHDHGWERPHLLGGQVIG